MKIKLIVIEEKIKFQEEFYNKMAADYGPSSFQALLSCERLEGMKSIQNICIAQEFSINSK